MCIRDRSDKVNLFSSVCSNDMLNVVQQSLFVSSGKIIQTPILKGNLKRFICLTFGQQVLAEYYFHIS